MLYEKSKIMKHRGEKMKTDLYTKTMLTLIVLFLGILSFDKVYNSFIREADALSGTWDCDTWSSKFINSASFYSHLINMGIQEIEMVEDKAGGGILVCMK
jgi:hypothetical protein